MPNQCCSSDFSFAFIQLIIYNRMLWLCCARCGLCLSHPPCHGLFSWIPSKLRLQYRLGDPAPLLSWRGRGVRDRHSRSRSGLLMSGCLIMAGRWLREEDGSPFRSGAVSLLSEERQMLSQMLLLPPSHLLCLVVGSSVCHLALSSRPALTLGVLMSCALSGFSLKNLCKGGRSWTVIQTPSYLEFLGPFERFYLCVLTYWKGL